MVSFAPTSPDTAEDQRRYTAERLVEVACQDCLARVGVKKNNDHHTSVQWTVEAVGHCTEFARLAGTPEGRRVYATCPRMTASIEQAVRDGQIEVGALDGY